MNEFKDLSDIFSGLRKVYNSRKGDNESQIKEKWAEIVGDFLYKYTRPDRVVKGILYIKTVSSSWLNEISFMKEEIIDSCNMKLGLQFITEVKIFVGDGKLETKAKEDIEYKLEQKKSFNVEGKISEKDRIMIEEKTSHIEDEALRNSLKNVLINSLIQERALLKQGWRKCLNCKALHNTKDYVCMICRKKLTKN